MKNMPVTSGAGRAVSSLQVKNWNVRPLQKENAARIAEQTGIPFFLAMMLEIRGFHTAEKVTEFLQGGNSLSNPYLLPDMEKAVARLRRGIDDFEKIAVYGDYDADGVTATSILFSYLQTCGADVLYYIPEREGEGYGMNVLAVEKLAQQGVRLIVTVDNGISSHQEVLRAKELGMEDSRLYWYLGVCNHQRDPERAIRDYSRSLELKETSEVYRNRGLCFTIVKMYDKAVLDFTRAIELPPGDKRLYRERGSAYWNLEEYEKAQADYEKALELEPADAELYTTLGDVQERLGEVQEALQSYQKAIQIDPNCARAYNNRGVLYAHQGEYQKALIEQRRAVKLAPNSAIYHANVGDDFNHLERYSEAVTSCNKAIKLDPGYAKAYSIRADAYEGLEQTEKAERDWETYRSLTKKTEEEEDTPQA